jgi:hypothetical protein
MNFQRAVERYALDTMFRPASVTILKCSRSDHRTCQNPPSAARISQTPVCQNCTVAPCHHPDPRHLVPSDSRSWRRGLLQGAWIGVKPLIKAFHSSLSSLRAFRPAFCISNRTHTSHPVPVSMFSRGIVVTCPPSQVDSPVAVP